MVPWTHFWFKCYCIPLFSKTLLILQVVEVIQCLQSFNANFTEHKQLNQFKDNSKLHDIESIYDLKNQWLFCMIPQNSVTKNFIISTLEW